MHLPAAGSEDGDEEFMQKWRQSRMQELSEGKRRISPNKRTYGRVDVVDANGYLDAVEKVTSDTVVVVCIYDLEVRSLLLSYIYILPLIPISYHLHKLIAPCFSPTPAPL